MREIKFRAWDKELKRFIYWNLGFEFLFSRCVVFNFDDFKFEENLMQYTGLKNKNGKEIYEGDIVQIDNIVCGIGNLKTFICKVVFRSGSFLAIDEKGYCQHLGDKLSSYKVVGNIYENPELLK